MVGQIELEKALQDGSMWFILIETESDTALSTHCTNRGQESATALPAEISSVIDRRNLFQR